MCVCVYICVCVCLNNWNVLMLSSLDWLSERASEWANKLLYHCHLTVCYMYISLSVSVAGRTKNFDRLLIQLKRTHQENFWICFQLRIFRWPCRNSNQTSNDVLAHTHSSLLRIECVNANGVIITFHYNSKCMDQMIKNNNVIISTEKQ